MFTTFLCITFAVVLFVISVALAYRKGVEAQLKLQAKKAMEDQASFPRSKGGKVAEGGYAPPKPIGNLLNRERHEGVGVWLYDPWCPQCGASVDEDDRYCSHCGEQRKRLQPWPVRMCRQVTLQDGDYTQAMYHCQGLGAVLTTLRGTELEARDHAFKQAIMRLVEEKGAGVVKRIIHPDAPAFTRRILMEVIAEKGDTTDEPTPDVPVDS